MVSETSETYNSITKPYIDSIPKEKLEWVYNILEQYCVFSTAKLSFVHMCFHLCSKSESERIILEDSDSKQGFILLPDFKWSNTNDVGASWV